MWHTVEIFVLKQLNLFALFEMSLMCLNRFLRDFNVVLQHDHDSRAFVVAIKLLLG